MRLRTATRAAGNGRISHLHRAGLKTVLRLIARTPISAGWVAIRRAAAGSAKQWMRVSWYLRRGKRNFLRACRFSEDEAGTIVGTHMHRQSAAQIRQRKRAFAITAIGRSY